LESTFEDVDDVGLACIYFNYKSRTTPKETIANILKQLLERTLTLSDDVEKFYRAHQKRDTQPTLPELSNLLRLESSRLSSVFIVVDALDECTADENVGFKILSELHQISQTRFMITGRPYAAGLVTRFDPCDLHIRANDDDVKRVLEAELMNPSFHKCLHEDGGLRAVVIQAIMAKADGMYVI
jgi:arsenate reductase-like glutaredoxin family protein